MSEIFPPEVLSNILSFLIDREDITLSRNYSEVNLACFHQVEANKSSPNFCDRCYTNRHPTDILEYNLFFVGRCLASNSTQDSEMQSRLWCNNAPPPQRTRGHLPEPRMDFCSNSDNNEDEDDNENINDDQKYTDAVFMDLKSLTALDLGSSHVYFVERIPVTGWLGTMEGQRLQRRLHTWWRHVHLGKYTNLKQMSARGCLHLKHISVPFTLLGLDCSTCSRLEQIVIPLIRKDDHDNIEMEPSDNRRLPNDPPLCRLVSLNLRGCRSLRTFGSVLSSSPTASLTQMAAVSSHYSRNLQEVDLSSCLKLSSQWIAALLQSTQVLESLSLRYIANNEMILALSQSASASSTLRLVDVAFSRALTDGSVETLVQASTQLERVNLRGCSKISSQCYNQTPILLLNKKKSGISSSNDPQSATADVDRGRATQPKQNHSRKGDNLFYFVSTQEEQAKKDRSSNSSRKRKQR